jgi:hypothetical protein
MVFLQAAKNLFLVFLILMTMSGIASADGDKKAETQTALSDLKTTLESLDVSHVQIFFGFDGDLPVITPSIFEQTADYKITYKFMTTPYQNSLLAAVQSSTVESIAEFPKNIRWGIAFYNWKNERSAVVYFAPDGKTGAINNLPVRFVAPDPLWFSRKPPLYEWLTSNFSDVFK